MRKLIGILLFSLSLITLIACSKSNYQSLVGIELNDNYYTLCKNIIKESTNEQLNLFNF